MVEDKNGNDVEIMAKLQILCVIIVEMTISDHLLVEQGKVGKSLFVMLHVF